MNVDLIAVKKKIEKKKIQLSNCNCSHNARGMEDLIHRLEKKVEYFEQHGRFPRKGYFNKPKKSRKTSRYIRSMISLKRRFKSRCFYCNRLDDEIAFNRDHYYPKSKYKQNSPEFYSKSGINKNYVYSCVRCNGKKRDMEPLEFAEYCAKSEWFTKIRDF